MVFGVAAPVQRYRGPKRENFLESLPPRHTARRPVEEGSAKAVRCLLCLMGAPEPGIHSESGVAEELRDEPVLEG